MKIAAYGTLRGGLHSAKYLTDKYGPDSVKVLDEYKLPGFDLYAYPTFGFMCPYAFPGERTLKVTLLEISDNGAAADIDRGESWGYDKVQVELPGVEGPVFIYQAHPWRVGNWNDLIESGDFLKFMGGES
jgi:gamma-glutamylcyclotransferase (GGCT)/AIG2-like uncharacterized protein YtfP